jgi:hypothetical protein
MQRLPSGKGIKSFSIGKLQYKKCYVADAIPSCPRWTNQRRKKPDEVGNTLLTLDDDLLVITPVISSFFAQ